MGWEIEMTDEFEQWLRACDQDLQEKVAAMFPLLNEYGPSLSRPFADTISGSRLANLKELRPTRTARVFFAFDPQRTAILLIGGDKTGRPQARWYRDMVQLAERLYAKHLDEVKHDQED
jgi:hypothetical protein